MYEYLKGYLQKNGNANVPQRYIAQDGLKLGRWVNFQKGNQNKLSNKQKIALESLNGWRWAKPEKTWEMLEVLKAYVEKNGNANIPQQYVTKDGVRLGRWFHRQRTIRDTLSVDRKRIFEELCQ